MPHAICADERLRCRLPLPVREPILALGADTACRPALARYDTCDLEPLCGDLMQAGSYTRFVETIARLSAACDPAPRIVAHDLHPNYVSTSFVNEMEGVTCTPVQHHEAHVASALTHFSIVGDVIGIAFDGTGYGPDRSIWGGELLVGSAARFRRAAHLQYVPMPGGSAAVRSPWKMAVSHVMEEFGAEFRKSDVPHFVYISDDELREIATLRAALDLSPMTSSVGRLFDAVAVLCGLFPDADVSLPARLEAMADRSIRDHYEPVVQITDEEMVIGTTTLIRSVVEEIRGNRPVGTVAAHFHNTLALATANACRLVAEETGIRTVVLTGGVFYNTLLAERLTEYLGRHRLVSYVMPPPLTGDQGIALGQAAIAAERSV